MSTADRSPRLARSLAAAVVVASALLAPLALPPTGPPAAHAETAALAALTRPPWGVQGTPHVWAWEGGALRWIGDTRALDGRAVEGGWVRQDRPAPPTAAAGLGDPLLSLPLLQWEGGLFLPKWETDWARPKLLH